MKKRLVILTIILGISLSGCSQKEANTEPTEAVIETEEKIVETETEEETEEVIETETEEPLEIADETYPGFSSENITINSDGKVTDYNEAFIKECRNYHMFDECNDEEVKEVFVDTLNCDADKVTMDASLTDDLQADSLDAVELNMAFEDKFGITIADEDLGTLKTVGDIFNYLVARAA